MKNIVVLFAVTLFSTASLAQLKIEYRVSRTQGLYNFVEALSGNPHRSANLREIFDKSTFNKADLQNEIANYKSLKKYLENPLTNPRDYQVPGRFPSRPISDIMLTQAIFAKDLSDLSQRTLGLLPLKVHTQYFQILKKFEPAYQDLIWNKSLTELNQHKAELEKLATQINLNTLFGKVALFYRANWPADVPFTVGLYPIPWIEGFNNVSSSQSMGAVEDHGVMIGMKSPDIKNSLAVIFHEICHSLYDSQSAEVMKNFSDYFGQSTSLYKESAYKWFNEAVATSIGNGWIYNTLNNGTPREMWYNDATIDGYARQIYPLTAEYLTQGKTMDRNYVEQSIQQFAKKFPESIYLYKDQFMHISFIHDGSFLVGSEVKDLFRSRFFVSGFGGSSPMTHPQTLQSATEDKGTLVVAFNGAEVKSLEKLIARIPFLKKNMVTLLSLKNRSYFAALDETARPFIIVRAETKQEFIAALDRMKSIGKIDPQTPVQTF